MLDYCPFTPRETKAFPHLRCMTIYCRVSLMELDTWHWQGWFFPPSCFSLKIMIPIFVWWCLDPVTALGPRAPARCGRLSRWVVMPDCRGWLETTCWGATMGRRKGCRGWQLSVVAAGSRWMWEICWAPYRLNHTFSMGHHEAAGHPDHRTLLANDIKVKPQ